MTETLTHFIGGKQISAPGALESTNPSNTNEIIAKFPDGSAEDVNNAVDAARSAFPGWSGATPEVRADLLDKVGSMIIERKDALGKLLASEEGKTLPEATGETVRAGRIFKYMAGEALRRHGQNLELGAPRRGDPDLSRSGRRLWPDHARGISPSPFRPGRSPRRWPSATPWC